MNNFLKTRQAIDDSTKFLQDKGLVESGISAKNYDLAQIVPLLTNNSDILDMGASGSEIISNAVRLGLKGRKVGIDLAYEESYVKDGVEVVKGDLMSCPFEDKSFDIITCLSVVEHSVNFNKLASECSRLLRPEGKLFVSFDYWAEKINTKGILLYNLEWNILDRYEAFEMVSAFQSQGFALTSEIDWTTQDAVINPQYCSPHESASYTFGLFDFVKKY